MLQALLGFMAPDAGQMQVLGLDVRTAPLEIRARIGYMPESDAHIPGMNAVSFVAYCGELAGLPPADAMQRAHEVLYYVGLGEARYRNLDTYSTGMKQRIKLAQALVHDPDLLFLDEPTNGMDPKGRDEMLELIRDIAHNKGINLILSSHLLPDVEYTCDYVVVLDKGAVATQGPIAALKGHGGPRLRAARQGRDGTVCRARSVAAGIECHDSDEDVHAAVRAGGRAAASSCSSSQRAHGVQVRHLRASVPTLEDVFARAVGERVRRAHSRSGLPPIRGPARRPRTELVGDCARHHPVERCGRAPCDSAAAGRVAAVPRARRAAVCLGQLPAGVASWPPRRRRSASSSTGRTSSSSSSPSCVGAGLIADDRRANALQIYLSKPLTRVEYIAGKLTALMAFLSFVTWLPAMLLLFLQMMFAGSTTFLCGEPVPVPRDHAVLRRFRSSYPRSRCSRCRRSRRAAASSR